MAGVGKQLRRLRTREVSGQSVVSPVPVTSGVGAVEVNQRTKAPAKRAANDDSQRVATAAPSQQAKKRAALTNLTNHGGNASNAAGGSKARGPVRRSKTQATECKRTEAPQGAAASAIHKKAPGPSNIDLNPSTLGNHNEENIAPGTAISSTEVKSGTKDKCIELLAGDIGGEAIAALERETQHNLYISSDSKARARQGYLLEENKPGAQGWSNTNYMDIDNNHKDPRTCSSYAPDIYHHLRIAELKRRPAMDFMDITQQDINASMRGILVDWLVEVAEEYKLVPDTLYLTVSYIDRFLSSRVVNRQCLQLLGVACMLIASKYEEISAPQVEEFCYITDNTYCRDEVLEMERQVLNHLHFELTGPTTKTFLRRFLRAAQACQKNPTLHMEFLGNYLAELTLLEYNFLKYLPSMIAGSSVFVAKFTLNPTVRPWTSTLQHYTGYRPSELRACATAIHDLQQNTSNCTLPAIREKYRQHKFKSVATIMSPAIIPSEYFEDLED